MARYIDAEEFLEGFCIYAIGQDKNFIKAVETVLEDTPTADVVEVVRCKDCIYKTVTEDGEYNPDDIVCGYHMSDGFSSDDFCSYGKQKENE